MQLSQEAREVVERIASSASFPEAVAMVPAAWNLFVTGAESASDAHACAAALVPDGLDDEHMLVRLWRQGLAQGKGRTRHEAVVDACRFILGRAARRVT